MAARLVANLATSRADWKDIEKVHLLADYLVEWTAVPLASPWVVLRADLKVPLMV